MAAAKKQNSGKAELFGLKIRIVGKKSVIVSRKIVYKYKKQPQIH